MSHHRLAALGLGGALVFTTLARAAPSLQVTLDYAAPPDAGCPSDSVFRARVASHLGYDPFRAEASLHVGVRAAMTDAGLAGRVEWHDDAHALHGSQAFPAQRRDCTHLVDEMAFAVAVQIQLLGVAGAAPSPPSSDREANGGSARPTPPAAPPVTAKPRPAEPSEAPRGGHRSSPEPWFFTAGAGPAVSFGVAPTVTASGRLFVAFHDGHASVQLAGEATAPSTRREADGSGFREFAATGELGVCGSIDRFALCGLGSVGRVWVRGFGVDQPGSPSGLFARAGLRLQASQPLGAHFALALRADGLVLVTPGDVTLNGTRVWSLPTFASAIGLDLSVRFR